MSNQSYGYNKAKTITKSDTVDFPTDEIPCEAIYVGGAGDVVVVFPDSSTSTFTCIAGQVLPVRARRVNSTNTTATAMRALYTV